MTKNPILNALAALAYITFVVCIMVFGVEKSVPNKSFVVPIAMLSLFTLSAAVMAYVFGYQPFQLYFDGKKKQALDLFLKTLATFAAITLVVFIILLSGIFK